MDCKNISLFSEFKNFVRVPSRLFSFLERLKGPRIVDMLYHLPSYHTLYTEIPKCSLDYKGLNISLLLEVSHHQKHSKYFQVFCKDSTGQAVVLMYFNMNPRLVKYLEKNLISCKKYRVLGTLENNGTVYQIVHPRTQSPDQPYSLSERTYPLTGALSQKIILSVMRDLFAQLSSMNPPEWLTPELLKERHWPSWIKAIYSAHYDTKDQAHLALERLSYDELLCQQLALHLSANNQEATHPPLIKMHTTLENKLRALLPFALTEDQENVLLDLKKDFLSPKGMRRLLQGDVGSGKTIVSFMAMLPVIENGYQTALLAPTEILAQQHSQTFLKYAKELGLTIVMLTGSLKAKERREVLEVIASGQADAVIGTHAIFQQDVHFHKLGFVVIDEQHRFGVEQRLLLSSKGLHPHMLSMTATPIPRTLQLANYGDLAVSSIRSKPKGRPTIQTLVMSLKKLSDVVSYLQSILEKGHQVYWICPLVEESEKSDLMAAQKRYEELCLAFDSKDIALLHGRMKASEKEQVMSEFAQGHKRLLVSTTVIEVGIDVPNATFIIIEHAERFGLAQLHQLRGRVGRGSKPSTCLLIYGEKLSAIARSRLKVMKETDDGFIIAEKDLALRGAGDIIGVKQAGTPEYRVADFSENPEAFLTLLEMANEEALQVVKTDPTLTSSRGQALQFLMRIFNRDKAIDYRQAV